MSRRSYRFLSSSPPPDPVSLRRLFFRRLDIVIADTPDELFDHRYWTNIFFSGIDHFIRTPRHAIRLINALRATYPALEGEVNPVDFIALETLRLYSPQVYAAVSRGQDQLTGIHGFGWSPSEKKEERALYEGWLASVAESDREAVEAILSHLFPKFSGAFGGTLYAADYLPEWRKNLRACSQEVFPTYFRFALPPGAITNAELTALLAKASDPIGFRSMLLSFAQQSRPDGTSRVRGVLERLEDYTRADIPQSDIPMIVESLIAVGDALVLKQDESVGFFDFGNDLRIGRLLYQLLSRLDQEARFDLLLKSIASGTAICIPVSEVVALGQEHGKHGAKGEPPQARMLASEQLAALEEAVLNKIRQLAEGGVLLSTPHLRRTLHLWSELAGSSAEARDWAASVTTDDDNLLDFLSHFLASQRAQSVGDRFVRTTLRLDPLWLSDYLVPDDIISRVRTLATLATANEGRLTAARQFIIEYDIRAQGKSPDAHDAFD